ncbi:MAG: hypothetical protein JO182_07880 [Acidobacteriaceae bacterium]|nr:hypothetical protein [Acidobacteriaceae bacterium]
MSCGRSKPKDYGTVTFAGDGIRFEAIRKGRMERLHVLANSGTGIVLTAMASLRTLPWRGTAAASHSLAERHPRQQARRIERWQGGIGVVHQ